MSLAEIPRRRETDPVGDGRIRTVGAGSHRNRADRGSSELLSMATEKREREIDERERKTEKGGEEERFGALA